MKSSGIASTLAVTLAVVLGWCALGGGLRAQEKRASPHEQASVTLAGKKVTIQYGRPYKKGRAIFGGLVPYGQVWRTGADEATTLTTDGDLMIGALRVPKGAYALFTVPEKDRWTLVVNKTAKQWGAFSYNAKDDLGRVPMKVGAAPASVEQFTIKLEPAGDRKATLQLSWENVVASAPLTMP
jgi:hypothetical protein